MKNIINGIEVSPFEAIEREYLSMILAKTITFVALIMTFGFILFFLYHVAEAQINNEWTYITFNDVKTAQNSTSFDLGVDMEALSKAVARHETNHCNSGGNFAEVGNCHGIRVYNGERLVPAQFPGYINGKRWETSYDAFIDLWNRKYGGLPTWEQAVAYSGNDRTEAWHNNVLAFYDEYTKTNLTF